MEGDFGDGQVIPSAFGVRQMCLRSHSNDNDNGNGNDI